MSATHHHERTVELPASVAEAFAYHERPGALQRLIPPWEQVVIEHSDQSLETGSEVLLKTKLGSLPLRVLARHTEYEPPNLFVDQMMKGPFPYWQHKHCFSQGATPDRCLLTDDIEYRLPLGLLGAIAGGKFVARSLDAMFRYRHRVTHDDLALGKRYDSAPLRVAISGRNGLVGSRLANVLSLLGHQSETLLRGDPSDGSHSDPANHHYPWSDSFNPEPLERVDAVVHLAGKPIADSRWNDRVKRAIRDSRVEKTAVLCQRLAQLKHPPSVLVCASATGIYGNRGDEELDESSEAGDGFLADVGRQWEAACEPARQAGIRVANLRIGIVLSPDGGALQKLLPPAKLGLGGPVANGRQWWSWIEIDDLIGSIYHVIQTTELAGPVNAVAPEATRNAAFAKCLGSVLWRPAIIPAPGLALRIALGEMATPLLLASARVQPRGLLDSGYVFRFPSLEPCLRHLLGKPMKTPA